MPELDAAARDALVHENLDLVDILARQVGRRVGSHVRLDDLTSYGHEGLLEASRRFEPERGVPFRAFATLRVRGAMLDGLRKDQALPRRAHERVRALRAATFASEGAVEDVFVSRGVVVDRAAADRALADHLAGMATAMALGIVSSEGEGADAGRDGPSSPEELVAGAELRGLLLTLVGELPEEEAMLVRRHYFEGERFDLVAAELGLSKSWASRLHTRALGRLGKRLKARFAPDDL